MEELELLARMSTEEHGIVVIKHAEMLPRLLVFLEGRFCGDRKQELASLIICNMFYVKEEELPGETLF